MYNPHQLSPASQEILSQMTAYHAERLAIFEKHLEADRRRKAAGDGFSLVRTIQAMVHPNGSLNRADRTLLEKCAELVGREFDPQRVFLPWQLLGRDLTVTNASSAGYLVGNSYGAAADVLRGWSITAGAGVTFTDASGGALLIPRVTTAPTVHALPSEGDTITESTPVLGQATIAPKSLGAFVDFSRQLALQANAEQFASMILLGALGQFLDKQVLQGSGSSGELLGLFNTTGLQTETGTSLDLDGVTTMKQLASEAGARDEDLAYVSTPAIRQLLEIREKASGNGGFIWQGGMVADRPAYASNECPAASMIVGPWSQVVIALFSPGVTLEVNPYEQAKFKQGIIEARVVLDADMGVIRPSAFVKSESIT
jgi:HK97 family phage major capsid protein